MTHLRQRTTSTPLFAATAALFLLVGGCGSTGLAARSDCKPSACIEPRHQVVDLTQVLQNGVSGASADPAFDNRVLATDEQGRTQRQLSFAADTGTHVEAPSRYQAAQRSIAQLSGDDLVLEAVVLDVRDRVANNADYRVTANDLEDWEIAHRRIPIGSFVIAQTGWSARFVDRAKYLNEDDQGAAHYPGFGRDAAQLLAEREVAAIGIDTMSVEGGGGGSEVRTTMAQVNAFAVHNLNNLAALAAAGSVVFIGVLPLGDGGLAPARVLAKVPLPEPKPFGE